MPGRSTLATGKYVLSTTDTVARAANFADKYLFSTVSGRLVWDSPCFTTREAGGVLLPDWLPRHINAKGVLALHTVLQQACVTHPDSLQRHR